MEVENVGWFGKILESIKGVLIGLVLVVVSFPLLFWNEGRAVHRAQDLEEGREAVVEASPDTVDPSQEGKLVHFSGTAATSDTVRDPVLGPSGPGALRLRRVVEMYQWREDSQRRRQKRAGGGERRTTEYRYRMDWSDTPIDSSQFHETGHANPPMPYTSETFDATNVTVGSRSLSPQLVDRIGGFQALPVQPAQVQLGVLAGRPVRAEAQGLYVGANPTTPVIGDVRLRWEIAPSAAVSVLAAQQGNTFTAWDTPGGRTVEQNLEMGTVSASQMFGTLEAGNTALTWGLRFVGWLLMFIGFNLIFRPLVAVADVLPFLGSIVGAGTFLVALVASAPLSLFTIAIGWIVYRPLLGIALLIVGALIMGGLGFLAMKIGRARNQKRAAQRAAAA